jgi:predicted small lipoprotein YifL
MPNCFKFLLLATAFAALIGCGQTGPLYMPGDTQPKHKANSNANGGIYQPQVKHSGSNGGAAQPQAEPTESSGTVEQPQAEPADSGGIYAQPQIIP